MTPLFTKSEVSTPAVDVDLNIKPSTLCKHTLPGPKSSVLLQSPGMLSCVLGYHAACFTANAARSAIATLTLGNFLPSAVRLSAWVTIALFVFVSGIIFLRLFWQPARGPVPLVQNVSILKRGPLCTWEQNQRVTLGQTPCVAPISAACKWSDQTCSNWDWNRTGKPSEVVNAFFYENPIFFFCCLNLRSDFHQDRTQIYGCSVDTTKFSNWVVMSMQEIWEDIKKIYTYIKKEGNLVLLHVDFFVVALCDI